MLLRVPTLARKIALALACASGAAQATQQSSFITCLRAAVGDIVHARNRRGPRIFIQADANALPPEEVPTVTIFSYNMQQFKNLRKIYRKNAKKDRTALVPLDYLMKNLQQQIELIARDRPSIAFLQEIETGADALADLSMIHLNDDYRVVVMPNANGTSTGWLLRKDLPIDFEIQSHIHVRDPYNPSEKLFVRDLAVLTARLKGAASTEDPLFTLMGVHYKSMGGSAGDPTGAIRRGREIEYTEKLMLELEEAYGQDYPAMILGDFNTHIPTAPELGPLRNMGFQEAFAVQAEEARMSGKPVPAPPITHTYFKKSKGKPRYTQLDGQLLSGGFRELDALIRVYVNAYLDEFGRPRGNPKTPAQRSLNSSDHFAVTGEYSFQKILARFFRKRKAAQEDVFPPDRPQKKP